MTTVTWTWRIQPTTAWDTRTKPIKYIQLLQDGVASVRDLDWSDIYVFADSWIIIDWTLWEHRTPTTVTWTPRI